MSRTGEMPFFNYGTTAPYLHYGVVDADSRLGGRPYRYNYARAQLPERIASGTHGCWAPPGESG